MGAWIDLVLGARFVFSVLQLLIFIFFRCSQAPLKKSSNTIVLEDHTNAQDVILNFITYEKPVILSDGKLSIGEASASFEGADLLAIETLPITDARLRTAWDHDLYRIRLKGNDAGFRLTIQ